MRTLALTILSAFFLSACASMLESETTSTEAQTAIEQPLAATPPVPQEEAPPQANRQLVMQPVPETKPVSARSKTAAPQEAAGKRSAAKPAQTTSPAVATKDKPALGTRPVPPASAGIMKVSMTTAGKPALQGPAWLKACKSRQDQGDVIMCDSDSLLSHPGDKVLVYTRDARKVGTLPSGGKVVLRESLPSVYRFFVLQ
jgi:hypothetical protein